jgi:hypothetical protein
MNSALCQVGVVCGDDPPRPVARSNQPRKDAASAGFQAAIERQFTFNRPFEMNQGQTVIQDLRAISPHQPTALAQMRLVNLAMPMQELLCSLQPPSSDIDKIDVTGDKTCQSRGVMSVPCANPFVDYRRYLRAKIVRFRCGVDLFAHCSENLSGRAACIDWHQSNLQVQICDQ